jgi:uncharacterized protein YyaL (SSP411 family)
MLMSNSETVHDGHDKGHSQYTNRLIHETSPYLLQHAHNPVDWYPWGEEALTKAKQEDKPILLSIGYSACHWCHVMAHESFENEQIAALMNQEYVSIKVDREERPDIDGIYMQAVQAITHQGGWPMTMFLLPDGRPFYGGTYFPPRDRQYGAQMMPGFPRVLLTMANAYREQHAEIEEQAESLANFLRQGSSAPLKARAARQGTAAPAVETLVQASQSIISEFDERHGGFGLAPKFPNTMSLEFLLRMHLHQQRGEISSETHDAANTALEVVESSLRHMAEGGIYDQLGGGFHRYSVDAHWLTPHFEKMLYDNALLSRLYLHTYVVTGEAFYRRIAEETLDYVVREMLSPEGGFYSTQDADSEGKEGKFFVWTPREVEQILPPEISRTFMRYYDVSSVGNFEGKNILHVSQPEQELADVEDISLDVLRARLKQGRELLFQAREQRIKPGRDEKILTSWNGLMLRSFAEAARYLDRPDYLQVAQRNATFLLATMRQNGRLLRTYKDGRAHLNGYLEDYAFLADGLLALYEVSFDPRWFREARELMDQAIALFADEQHGGFFDTGKDHETLVSRPKDIMDNAIPAGNSIAAEVLLRLTALSGEQSYRQRAEEYLQGLSTVVLQHPQFFAQVINGLDFVLSASKEIALIGDPAESATQELLKVVNARYLPNSVLACAAPENTVAMETVALLADRPLKDNRASAYVCQNFACQTPVNTGAELAALLG